MRHLIAGHGWSDSGVPEFSGEEVRGVDTASKYMKRARFGKGGGGSPPPAPNPQATAAAQAAANKDTAIAQSHLNMVNQYTPYGSLEYSQRGTASDGTPQYSATQKLSPNQQTMLNLTDRAGINYGLTANNQLDSVKSKLSQPLDFQSLGPMPVANEAARQRVSESIMGRLQPQFDRDKEQLEARLATQGIGIGSQAYGAAMDDYGRAVNDARLAADNAALGQMSGLFGLESNSRDRMINEMIQQRTHPINELSALLSGGAVQNPQFVNTPQSQIGQTDVAGPIYASYNGQMNAYNQAQQRGSGLFGDIMGAVGSLGGAAIMASDRRLKKNIEKIGEAVKGLGIYAYEYVWGGGRKVGFMADEVRKVFPSAVINVGGFDAVNYAYVIPRLVGGSY